MASISDVAQIAKVSPSTVSLVANGRTGVSESTRKRVQEAIERLGYSPRGARRKCHVGVLYMGNLFIDGYPARYCAQWLEGIRDSFRHSAVDISAFVGQPHVSHDPTFQEQLQRGQFDGLIVMGVHPKDGYLDFAVRQNSRLVVINRWPQRNEFSSVRADYHGAGYSAARHLLAAGHQRLGIILSQHSRVQSELRAGFHAALAECDLSPVLDLPGFGGVSPELASERQVQQMLDAKVTAIFSGVTNCQRVGNRLLELGHDLPREVSLIGMDDLELKLDNGLRITSISFDAHQMGRIAARLLVQLLEMGDNVLDLHATVLTDFIPADTVAPPG